MRHLLLIPCALAIGCSSPSNQAEHDVGASPVAKAQAAQKNHTGASGETTDPVVEGDDVTPKEPVAEPEPPPPPPPPAMIPPPENMVMKKITLAGIEKHKWWKFGDGYFRLWGHQFTGSQPKSVSVTHDGSKIFVCNTGYHDHKNVTRFDPEKLGTVVEASFKGNAIEQMVSPDDKHLWVSNFYHHEVLELSTETLKVERRFAVGNMPKHFAIHPDHKTLWISNWASDDLSVVDLASGKEVSRIDMENQPRGTVVLNSGKKAYVTNFGSKSVSVIDTEARKVIKSIPTNCRAPRHAAVSSDDRVFVSCYGGHEVLVIDTVKDEIVKRLDVGNGPKTIELSKDEKFAYTADYRGASMTMIDLSTWETLIVPLPTFKTSGLAVASDDKRIYLTGWTARNLMVLERLMPGEEPPTDHGPMKAGKVCRQTPKSDCYKYP